MKKEIICSNHFFELDWFFLYECTPKKRCNRSYEVKHVQLDEIGKPARIVTDYCDTFIDAFYHYKQIVNDTFKKHLEYIINKK